VHWDGGSWTRIVDPAFEGTSTLFTVWGSGPDHVFIPAILPTGEVDSSGYSNYVEVIEQWDGSAWSQVSSPASIGISSISGSGPDDVFAVGQGGAMHWDGTMWSSLPAAPEQLNAIWAGGPGGVFAVGSTGTVYKWDGRSWTVSYMGGRLPAGGSGTGGIYGVGATVFAGTGQTMLRWDGSTWSPTTPLAGLKGVWASGPDDAYAISDSAISRWDGTSWATVGPGPMVGLNDVWGSGPNDVFVVGAGGTVAHWNGSVWSQTVQQPAYSVLCPNGGGSDIRCQQPPAFDLRRVWGTGSNDVFAVGDGAPFFHDTLWLLHWDGASWSTLWLSTARPFNEDVSGLWASGPHDVFITASDATFHYDGANLNLANLNPMSAGLQTPSFQELWGAGPDDVFAVGAYGTIAHWDGAQWTPMTSGTSQDLMAVNGSGAGDVFAAGGSSVGGALLHLRGGIWEPIRLPGVKDVHGLAVTPRRVFVVGDEGEIHLDRPSVTCVGPERDCHDGWDNDCDGLADADDPDCAGLVTEQCANLADDDGDGKIDCADPDCADFWLCKVH
jgi:hypothetical protein